MHWFDRLSQQLAIGAETRATRRGVVKGGALAAVTIPLAAPAASEAFTYARNRVRARASQNACLDCFAYATKLNNIQMHDCATVPHGPDGSLLPPGQHATERLARAKPKKKKNKKKKKLRPWEAAGDTACQANARLNFWYNLEQCRTKTCVPAAPPPSPAPNGNGSACSGGTTKCGDTICCYGGDACCPCTAAGGLICCAAVIGCTCC
jgi:hypothetical protein